MDENRQLQLVAIISCIFSSFVMMTLLLFPSMRSRLFMRIIFFISLSDFMGNLPYTTVHRPSSSSTLCSLEGFCNLYFYPVSWMWTTILVYFLYGLATEGKVPLSEVSVHVLCWGVPLVSALLVLTTNTYSRFDQNDDNEVCTIGGNETSAFVWRIFIYYGLLFVCVLTMLSMYLRVIRIQTTGRSAVSEGMLTLAMESLQLYPLAMTVSWLPEFVTFFLQFEDHNDLALHISSIIKLSNGIFLAIIFFSKSQHARHLWLRLLTQKHQTATREYSHDSSTCFDIMEDLLPPDQDPRASLISNSSMLFGGSKTRQISMGNH